MSGINGIGSNSIAQSNDVSALETQASAQKAAVGGAIGNVVEQFAGGAQSAVGGVLGGLFGSLGSLFGGGKSNSANGFDLGAIISAIFDNPIFKLFEGIFGGGKKLEPVSVPPPQGQPLAQDAEGALFGARAGASASDEPEHETFDSNHALTNGFSLAALDDIDNTGNGDVANLARLEGDK